MQAAPILAKLPTDRQSAILDYIEQFRFVWKGRGATNRDIAERLKMSPRTIRRDVTMLILRGFVKWDTRQGLDVAPGIVFAGEVD